jgi:pimeloyl-ACP methyl ester carboxylesterase
MDGDSRTFDWYWAGKSIRVGYDVLGEGPAILLLPAFSTVSTREEMAPLAARLAEGFRTIAADWPGFGRSPAPKLTHSPDLHRAFLAAFVDSVLDGPTAVVAAGHAAGYVLSRARQRPGAWSSIVLVAPTWRGPLPTMMGGYRPFQDRVRKAIEAPIIGPALYRLNVAKPVIAAMYRRHVYADRKLVVPEFLNEKVAVARRPGGRFGSAAFVTGALDPVRDHESFLALASPPPAPTLVIYGADTPPRSRMEMEALAALPGVESHCLAHGSLGVHEEEPEAIAAAASPFLQGAVTD